MVSDSQPSELVTTNVEVPIGIATALLGAAAATRALDGGARQAALAAALDAPDAFLTPGAMAQAPSAATTAQLAREVALLKLRAFRGLCRALVAATDPDLELLSLQAVGRLHHRPAEPMPARWQVELELQLGDRTLGVAPGRTGTVDGRPALGLLLATLLLANDAIDPDDVELRVRAFANRLAGGAGAAQVREELATDPAIDARAVLHDAARRDALSVSPLPARLWCDLLAEAVLLVAPTSRAAQGPLGATLPSLLSRLDQLVRRLSIEAIGREARREDLLDVLRPRTVDGQR